MLLTWPLLTLTAGILVYLLVNNHFEVQFVYEVTSRSMPTYLKVTAWWGGQAGSLLFWSWLMSAFTSLVTLRKWDRDREFLPWVIVVCGVTMMFFVGMNVFLENPFQQLYQTFDGINPHTFQPANSILFTPQDGRGLNPLLRHPGMVIHPPMLYLGFVSFVIPGSASPAAGRCGPGSSSLPVSCSVGAGRTMCSAGAVTGAGTRWRSPRSCPGSPALPFYIP
jgi:cytochrome c-type biogenesis protein CcmF